MLYFQIIRRKPNLSPIWGMVQVCGAANLGLQAGLQPAGRAGKRVRRQDCPPHRAVWSGGSRPEVLPRADLVHGNVHKLLCGASWNMTVARCCIFAALELRDRPGGLSYLARKSRIS